MIQRIQSIYLLLVAILMAITAVSPLFEFKEANFNMLIYSSLGIGDKFNIEYPTWGVFSIAILSALMALVNIFFYKKRKVQIKIAGLTTFFIALFYVTVGVYFYAFIIKTGAGLIYVDYGLILPSVALIFNILATLKIKKDEKLVKSLDRIR